MFYGYFNQFYTENISNDSEYVYGNFLFSSTLSGVISSFITNPLDVIKTRMQVAKSNPTIFPFNNSYQCMIHLIKNEHLYSLFDGVKARILWLTPRYIVAVSLFEGIKNVYNTRKPDNKVIIE